MASAIKPFRKLQAGLETVQGTAVAAVAQLLGEWAWTEQNDFYRAMYPRGINANVGGAGVPVTKGVQLAVEGDLTAEEMPWLLGAGVRGGVVGGAAVDSAYTRVYTPQLTALPTGPGTVTFEQIEGDGTTNHVAREVAFGVLDSFEISSSPNENVKLTHNWFARASQTSTPTAALVPMVGYEPLVHGLAKVFVDTTWAGLGGTQLLCLIHDITFGYQSPFEPKYTMDGRADLDFTCLDYARGFKATLDLTTELDATAAAAFITAYRANSLRYIRLQFNGSVIAPGTTARKVQIDGAYRFVAAPAYDEDTRIVSISLESLYDETGAATLLFTVVNGIALMPA